MCVVYVDFCDLAVFELFGFSEHIFDGYVVGFCFGVDYVLEDCFSV